MSRRISRDPKILPMILETEPPMVVVVVLLAWVSSDLGLVVRVICGVFGPLLGRQSQD